MADYAHRPGNDTRHLCSTVARKARLVAVTCFAILFATACSESLPPEVIGNAQPEVRLNRSESDERRNTKSRQRTRIKFRRGETSEILLERNRDRVLAIRRKDRSGKWHDVMREDGGGGASNAAYLIQNSEPEQSAVGTFVADGEFLPYGNEEWYDENGVHWRVKSLGASPQPPTEEIIYRSGILTTLHNYSWTRQEGGWLLTATRTDIYDYDNGGAFVAEVVDSLHHWTGTSAKWYQERPAHDIPFALASMSTSVGCNEAVGFYFAAAECPTCVGDAVRLGVSTASMVASSIALGASFQTPGPWTPAAIRTTASWWAVSWASFTDDTIQLGRCVESRIKCQRGSGGTGTPTQKT